MDVRSSAASMYALVAIAVIVVIAALALALRVSPTSVPSTSTPTTAIVFAAGRSTVYTTPRTQITARLQHPASVASTSIRWQVTDAGATAGFAPQAGSGSEARFTSPQRGSVVLTTSMVVAGTPRTFTTRFVVQPADKVVASRVEITGDVTINGHPAVPGEALPEGTLVDASRGSISYTVPAARNLNGRIRMAGSEFVLTNRAIGQRRLTTARMRVPAGASQRLQSDVQHLDGVRYVAVESPDAVAMVKGTSFDVESGPAGTTIEVDHGLVMVFDRVRMFAAPVYVPTGSRAEVERSELVDAGTTWNGIDTASWALALPSDAPDQGGDQVNDSKQQVDDADSRNGNDGADDSDTNLLDDVLEFEVEHGTSNPKDDPDAVWATLPALPDRTNTSRFPEQSSRCDERADSRRCMREMTPPCGDCKPGTSCEDCDGSSSSDAPLPDNWQQPGCEKNSCKQRPDRPARPTPPDMPEHQCSDPSGCSTPANPGPEHPGGSTVDEPAPPDSPIKPPKPERPDRPDRPDRPERPGGPERPDRPDRPDRPGGPDRPERPERPDRPDRPERPERPPRGERRDPSHSSVMQSVAVINA